MAKIYLSQPHLTGKEIENINKVIESNYLTYFGEYIQLFEKKMSEYYDGLFTLATSSGTSAIHLGLRALGVTSGDVVFCSSFTFVASANPVRYLGAELVFIDSEPDTWNMSPVALANAFKWAESNGQMPKAVIVVDLYGQGVDYESILQLCNRYKVPILEDATEALGAKVNGKKCGSFGDIAALSFASNKLITTSGGGMVICNKKEHIDKMRYWAGQAREELPYYLHNEMGYNYRMSNLNAAVGCPQVDVIDLRAKRRTEIYLRYKEEFRDLEIEMMPLIDGSCAWLSVIYLNKDNPLKVVEGLDKYGIEARMAWKPLHTQPVYKDNLYFEHNIDFSSHLFEHSICLPSASVMTDEDQTYVIKVVTELVSKKE